jgi:hypothetical protein
MSDRKEISTELLTISPALADIPFQPVFAVPAGYFDDFPLKMVEMIKKEEKSGVLAELETISPLLASLDRKNPFTVPDGYFSALEKDLGSAMVSQKLVDEQAPEIGNPTQHPLAKVVKLGQPGRLRVLYAAASIVALLGFFTWFFVVNNSSPTEGKFAVNIYSELPKLSATEMANYLETAPVELNLEPLSLAGVEEADLDEIMKEINEAELQQFINENPVLLEKNMN